MEGEWSDGGGCDEWKVSGVMGEGCDEWSDGGGV